jgi:hypothetical protein
MDILATYPGESWEYKSARLMYITGKQDAQAGSVGTIVSPRQAEGVIIDSGLPDIKVFSLMWKGELRQLLVKIKSKGGEPSSCTVRLIKPRPGRGWKSLSGDGALVSNTGIPLLFNPHALAEWGDLIYLIDYESRSIVILGEDELAGMSGDYVPLRAPVSLADDLPGTAKGQAIIVIDYKLYALYLAADDTEEPTHEPGILCRLDIGSNGALTYETQTSVGKNPQAIIPVYDGTAYQLLIPAIGGAQYYTGATSSIESNITCVPARGDWPDVDTGAPVLVTGDAYPPPTPPDSKSDDPAPVPTAYDIHAVAAGSRCKSSMLYILTQIYNGDRDHDQIAYWRLYKTTVGQFLALASAAGAPLTLSGALTSGLEPIDEGEITSIVPGGIYFWDLLYAQTPEISDAGDLLWVALGSPLLVTRAAEGGYGAPDVSTPDGEIENAYLMFGFNGGNNVNSIDLTIEAINQEKRGNVSLKRGLSGSAYSGGK